MYQSSRERSDLSKKDVELYSVNSHAHFASNSWSLSSNSPRHLRDQYASCAQFQGHCSLLAPPQPQRNAHGHQDRPPNRILRLCSTHALAAKDKKTISKEPSFLYHGLDVPEDTPPPDLEDAIIYPLPMMVRSRFYGRKFAIKPSRIGITDCLIEGPHLGIFLMWIAHIILLLLKHLCILNDSHSDCAQADAYWW